MTQFDQKMEALRTRFISRAGSEIAALCEAHIEQDDAAMRQIAHSLAGNAGLFGWPELGQRAREFEELLDRPASAEEVRAKLDAVLAAMPR